MTIYTLSHDAFSRDSLARQHRPARTLPYGSSCAWCGNRNRHGGLFQYGTERDDRPGRVNWHSGLYCSKACHDSYSG